MINNHPNTESPPTDATRASTRAWAASRHLVIMTAAANTGQAAFGTGQFDRKDGAYKRLDSLFRDTVEEGGRFSPEVTPFFVHAQPALPRR